MLNAGTTQAASSPAAASHRGQVRFPSSLCAFACTSSPTDLSSGTIFGELRLRDTGVALPTRGPKTMPRPTFPSKASAACLRPEDQPKAAKLPFDLDEDG